jgi:hypothetical protein
MYANLPRIAAPSPVHDTHAVNDNTANMIAIICLMLAKIRNYTHYSSSSIRVFYAHG